MIMQVIYKLLLLFGICFCCFSTKIWAYKIPNVKLELLQGEGFRISIPDETGIAKVFYVMEINEMCPAQMNYITEAVNGIWTTKNINIPLQDKDKIGVSLLVQFNKDVYINTEYIEIQNGVPTSIECREGDSLLDKCETNDIDVRKTDTFESIPEISCKNSISTTHNIKANCENDILFEDNFSDDLSQWDYDIRIALNKDAAEEFVLFDNQPNNSFIKDGILNIIPTLYPNNIRVGSINLGSKCTPLVSYDTECEISSQLGRGSFLFMPPVISSQITTKNKFSFRYGMIEISAQMPRGDWLIPNIMLKPVNAVNSYKFTRMNIAFARGNENLKQNGLDIDGSRLYGFLFDPIQDLPNGLYIRDKKNTEHFGKDYHLYTLKWTDQYIEIAVDGEVYGKFTENLSIFQEEFYIVLGVTAGGHFNFPDNTQPSKPWENTSPKAALQFWKKRNEWMSTWKGDHGLKIDYVRVYAV